MGRLKGSKHTPETKRKISKARFGKVRGEKHHNWKGGRKLHLKGYVLIRIDGKYVLEHRVVMGKHLGRILTPEEIVHHKNGIRTDNQIENLELMTKSQHSKYHMPGNPFFWGHKHSEETKRRISESHRKRREKETAGGTNRFGQTESS